MPLLDKYLKRTDFDSYEDFIKNFEIVFPDSFNFAYDVLDYWAESEPEKLALVYEDDFGRELRFTFAQMKTLSDKAANYLTQKGITKGDVVMLTLKRRYHFWYLIMALHKIGAVCVTATEQLRQKDYEYRFANANVKMIISINEKEHLDDIDKAADGSMYKGFVGEGFREDWDNIDAEIEKALSVFAKPENCAANEDLMLMFFTSGTTGEPKIVAHDYLYPLAHITTAYYWNGCENDGLHLSVAETGWAKCAWGKLYGQWLCGCAVMVYDMESFDPERLLDIMEKYPLTSFCAPPTIFRFLIRADLSKRRLSHIKNYTTAGEALNAEVYDVWHKQTGGRIREGFGQSESVIIAGTFIWMEPKAGSMGKPNALFDIKLISEEGDFAEAGEAGQISVLFGAKKPAGLFREYYNDEIKTLVTFAGGVYYTGDLAYRDEGGYLWFIGRADDIIKTSGYRVGPFEVESAIMRHGCVLECAVTGVPDQIRGQIIKATIVLNKGYEPCEELKKELQDFVKSITAPYKYPRMIEFASELPKTFSGKIKRFVLRENHKSQAI